MSRHLLSASPSFDLHQIYRALSVLSEHSDFVQAELYKQSKSIIKRSTGILFYDCTNYFFELEQESGLKQYGPSKEHRPNPIVQIGLFMDKSGIPLAFCINPGSQNEQLSLKPLEQQIITFHQTLIVSYSLKYKAYQQNIRSRQVERAKKYLEHPSSADRRPQNDAKRFVKKTSFTQDGELAHFLTCFISLMIYRILEKQLKEDFTCEEIIRTLRDMDMRKVEDYGYIPNYTRTELTDRLHEIAGFRTDYELTTPKSMAGIIRRSKGL